MMQIFEVLDSTQLEAKRQIDVKEYLDNEIILARTQTAGITTKENINWVSLKGNLLVSYVFNLNQWAQTTKNKNHIFFCVGLAIRDCIIFYNNNCNALIKWPNDIIVNKKKICGTICDIYKNHLIIGVGLNLIKYSFNTHRFPATDLETETGIIVKPEHIAIEIQNKTKEYLSILYMNGFNVIKEKWKKYAYMIGEKIEISDGNIIYFNDIDDDGNII